MILHLESGNCSVDELDLGQSVAMCFQWKHFLIDAQDRESLRDGRDILTALRSVHGPGELFYKCPVCDQRFPKLSGLFMHVESPACGATFTNGSMAKLLKWLENRHR